MSFLVLMTGLESHDVKVPIFTKASEVRNTWSEKPDELRQNLVHFCAVETRKRNHVSMCCSCILLSCPMANAKDTWGVFLERICIILAPPHILQPVAILPKD